MLNCTRRLHRFISCIDFMIGNNQEMINTVKFFPFLVNYHSQIRLYKVIPSKDFVITNFQSKLLILRNKSKGKRTQYSKRDEYESSDDEDEFEDENDVDKNASLRTCVQSLRADLVLKTVLKITRKKIEDAFYQNKIRINGKALLKKSQNVQIGDEIDLIQSAENLTQNTMKVERVQILNVKLDPDTDKYLMEVCIFKSLIIKNYSQKDAWRPCKEDE